ncbi:MAG TPA: VIT domain-containing protein, partial [Planctomycetota bacterium]|nr:VIT domain-containing protein [Planctomycetota bacterium]
MKCEQAELLMAELLAGEIRPEARAALEAHLVECAACRGDFAAARAGFQVEWEETVPSRRLVERTLASFREPPSILRFFRWGTAAAAALAMALLILGSGRSPAPVAAAKPAPPPRYLAMVQDAVVGSLVAKDEQGRPAGELGLQSHAVSVEILDGIAKTTVEENFENHTDRRLEGTFHFPLPPDASISRLALEVNGKMEEGTCLERERAREVFEGIVRRMQDPALLEWMPGGMFQCRVFPIEPHATKRVIVAYTQALPYFRGKLTYVYPLASEKTKAHPPEELRIDVAARFGSELRRIESPSHRIDVQRAGPNEARASFAARNLRPENDFVLTMETADEELRAVPHKVDGEDGYFALFLTPRGAPERRPGRYAFVLDISASVTGPELEVARRGVRAMMERRIDGDRFEVLAHHVDVERSGEVDLRQANDFMDRLSPVGGSDLLKALQAAPADAEIVYLGGGTPTYGETDPAKILEAMKGRRIRTVGIGSKVNSLLLEKLGVHVRISPNDGVDARCAELAARLGSPVLSEIRVDGGDAVYDVVGVRDIVHGERLVVTGRYRGPAAKLIVTGRDYKRELAVTFPAKEEGNNYVRRLWAQRKIADLLALGESKKAEVTDLGVKHQIMTPYTSFLVLENEQMWKDHQLKREVQKEDKVLGEGRKGKSTEIPDGEPLDTQVAKCLQEGTDLFKLGKNAEAASKFEEAFQLKPSSDQVYAYIKRVGDTVVGRMMNDPDRKVQDIGRRVYELAKPGEHFREGKAVVEKHLEDLKNVDEIGVWRNAFWHLKNMGPHAVKQLLPALGDQVNDRYRARVQLVLTEMGVDAAPAVAEALKSGDPFVRQQAAIVLGNIKDERTLPALARLREDPAQPPEVRKFVEEAILKIDRRSSSLKIDEPVGQLPSTPEVANLLGRVRSLEAENALQAARVADLLKSKDPSTTLPTRQEADLQVFVRQLEFQLAQIQELTTKVEEHRSKLAKVLNEKSLAVAEVQYARQQSERLSQDLAELEEKHVGMARDKRHLEEKVNHLGGTGVHRLAKSFRQTMGNSTGLVTSDLRIDRGSRGDFPAEYAEVLREYFRPLSESEKDGTPVLGNTPVLGSLLSERGLTVGYDGGLYYAPAGFNSVAHGHFEYDMDLSQHPFDVREIAGRDNADEHVENYPSSVNGLYLSFKQQDTDKTPPGIFTLTTNVTAPGAPITDALPVDMSTNSLVIRTSPRTYGNVLEEKINHLNQLGIRTDIAPKKPLEGKVTAVANEIGLVV